MGQTADDRPPVRVGLVLGAGGVAGGAFHAGVLAALAEATGWDPRAAAVVVGTSAGSVTAAGLRAGLSAADMLARARGTRLSPEGDRLLAAVGPPMSPPPLRPERGPIPTASAVAELLRSAARRPLATRPSAMLASLLPDGSVPTEFITAGIGAFVGDRWPDEPMWICAVRRRGGRRVVFGRDRSRLVPVPLAVAASCAIPGVFEPVAIDGDAFIDGGAHSPTNADVLLREDLDLVVVSSPMSIESRALRLRVDQPARRWARALLDTEVIRLRRRGVRVVTFQPTVEDLEVMGLNAMDPSRRRPIAEQAHRSALARLARADVRARLERICQSPGGG